MPSTKLVAADGDSVSRIAEAHGLAPDSIWSHPDNAELRAKREHMDVLGPGDVLTIPERTQRSVRRPTGARHRFRRRGVPMRFVLQLADEWGQARTERPYVLHVDGQRLEGLTDADGVVSRYIPNAARRGRLEIDELTIELVFGGLDPLTELRGVQQRLTNMGLPCVEDRGELGRATVLALRQFQRMIGREPSGELDDGTREAIGEHHRELGTLIDAQLELEVDR